MRRVENLWVIVVRDFKNEKYQVKGEDDFIGLFFSKDEALSVAEGQNHIYKDMKVLKAKLFWDDKRGKRKW